MITVPLVDEVLEELGSTPEQLEARSAVAPARAHRLRVRGLMGIGIGIVVTALAIAATAAWHWVFALVLAAGLVILGAGTVGLAASVRLTRRGSGLAGRELLTAYLSALARRVDVLNPKAGPTELTAAHQSEAAAASLAAAQESGLFPRARAVSVDDVLTGTALGTPFSIRELAVSVDAPYLGGAAHRTTAFDGLLTTITVPVAMPGQLWILGRHRGPALDGPAPATGQFSVSETPGAAAGVPVREVPAPGGRFAELFEVRATDPGAAAILVPELCDRLVALAEDAATDDIALRLGASTISCAIADDKDMFEAPEAEDLLAQVASLHEDLALCLRLVDLLARTADLVPSAIAGQDRGMDTAAVETATGPSASPLIIGHRGAASLEPENTLRSFRRALADGADGIECDVHLSADGQIVVMHDETLDRTADAASPLREGALAELDRAALDTVVLGDGEGVPALTETLDVLEEVRSTGEGASPQIYVEVKAPAAAEAVGAMVADRTGVTVISFHPDALAALRRTSPGTPIGYIVHEADDAVFETAAQLDADALSIDIRHLGPEAVERAHAAGMIVNTWTVNTAEQLRRAVDSGADTVSSDDPGWARQELARIRP